MKEKYPNDMIVEHIQQIVSEINVRQNHSSGHLSIVFAKTKN